MTKSDPKTKARRTLGEPWERAPMHTQQQTSEDLQERQRLVESLFAEALPKDDTADVLCDFAKKVRLLMEATRLLTPQQKSILVALYVDDLTILEAAPQIR